MPATLASSAPATADSPGLATSPSPLEPIRVRAKFFFEGDRKFFVKGVTYGPFAPAPHGTQFPERDMVAKDFALMAEMGVTL